MRYRLAKGIGWGTKSLGTILDLRELYRIFGISGGSGVMGAIIAFIKGYPFGIIVVVALGILLLTLFVLILRKRRPYYDNIKRVPRILYNIHERTKGLALKKGEKIDSNALNKNKQIADALADVMGISKKQADSISKSSGKLGKRRESTIAKAVEASHITESTQKLTEVATIMERNNFGLKQLCDKDFRYNYYQSQLDSLQPMPTVLISNEVENFLSFSYAYSSLLMIQKPLLPTINEILSTKVADYNWRLVEYVETTSKNMLAGINERIEKYITEKEENGSNKK